MLASRIARATSRRFFRARLLPALIVCALAAFVAPSGASAGELQATRAPEVVGPHDEEIVEATPGERIVCSGGTWRGEPKLEYEWIVNGVTVQGPLTANAGGELYLVTVKGGGEEQEISCNVLARQNAEQEEEESSNTVIVHGKKVVKEYPPVNEVAPKITPETAKVGQTLTCEPGKWSESPSSYRFTWLRGGSPISGATESAYKVATADEGHSLSCAVVAVNKIGSSESKLSSNSVAIAALKIPEGPAPEVIGTLEVGKTLTCVHGEWTGEPTFAYQWVREGNKISGATGSTHVIESEDQTHRLACELTATNAAGHVTKSSKETAEVPGSAPVDLKRPEISGTPKAGEMLTCSKGEWSGVPAPTFTYQWLVGNVAIAKATSATYTVPAEDRGKTLTCEVKAKSSAGSADALSNSVVIPEEKNGEKPVDEVPPEVHGTGAVGGKLECATGTWRGTPTPQYAYEWVRNLGESGEAVISGATSSSYTVREADEGSKISCEVTASNSEGSTTKASSNRITVAGAGPTELAPPEIFPGGEVQAGETLTCSAGEWSGHPTPTFEYQWLRHGGAIGSATGYSYTVVEGDRGENLECEVTAKNSAGDASARSEAVHVEGSPPYDRTQPSVAPESPKAGETIRCEPGEWEGTPKPTFAYHWQINGEDIAPDTEHEDEYTVLNKNRGRSIRCQVTAKNAEGEGTGYSKSVVVAGSAPEPPEGGVQLSGSPAVGNALTCTIGEWSGKPTPSFSIQWLLDGTPIAGATGTTYTVPLADENHFISCEVAGTNEYGSETATSSSVYISTVSKVTSKGEVSKTPTEGEGESTSKPVSAAEILSRLNNELLRLQHAVRLRGLRKHRTYAFSFNSPTGGTLEYSWYLARKGAALSKAGAKKPLLVARATASFTGPAKKTIVLHLTSAGLRLLRTSQTVRLTGKGVFLRSGLKPVSWLKTFELKS